MKRKSLLVSSFALAFVMLLGAGCMKKLDDAKMSSDIQNKFSEDSGLANKQLTVQVNDGVVTLSGTVDNASQRDAAGRKAASLSGVKTVINNLQIGETSAAMTPPPQAAAPVTTPSAQADTPPAEKPDPGMDMPAEKPRPREKSKPAHKPSKSSNSNQQTASNDQMPPPSTSSQPPTDNSAMSTPAPAPAPVPPPPPKKFIVDQGTQLTVRLVDPIDSEKNQTGDSFHATLNAPITSDGEQAIPAGVEIRGHLVSVKSAGKFAGQSEVVMQLDSVSSGGRTYNLQTDQYKKTGSSRGKNTAEKVGGGAIIGGIIGAIAGGGKGAAIGSAAGAGVGGGVQAATKSQQIKLASETILNFTLQAPITVIQAQSTDANRQKLGDSQ